MAGRAPKLTKELIDKAVELKGNGLSNIDICAACEISQAAFYRWQENGGDTALQRELVERLKKAEVDYQAALLSSIMEAGRNKDWKAHAWLLERKYPEKYGRVDRLQAEVQNMHSGSVQLEHFFDYGDTE